MNKTKQEFKKVKWLFDKEIKIPKKWEIHTISQIFEFLRTAANSRDDLKDKGDTMYIHYGDIHQKWDYVLDCKNATIPYINHDKVQKASVLKNGDLIIADASEDHEGSGASILIKNIDDRQIVSGLHTIALRDSSGITDSNFRAYITSSRLVKIQIISYVTGISVYGLSKTNLGIIRVPTPSLLEQQKIASILSGVDATIEATQKV
ncbi:MAG: restriction endonuclease subunit S, partial [Candidatus Poribacteria bacterium]|nr:restriction endonuclease subunit S [Candidatus Poribacteria bacterium]